MKQSIWASAIFLLLLIGAGFSAYGQTPHAEKGPDTEIPTLENTLRGIAEGFGGELAVDVRIDNGDIAGIEIAQHSETPSIADSAFEELIYAVIETQSTEVDVVSGATKTSEAFLQAIRQALGELNAEIPTPGDIFRGIAEGFGGELVVDVQLENGSIADIQVAEHSETASIAEPAFEELIYAVIETQSTEIDIVSGATKTSEAFLRAVQQALDEAEGE